MLTGAPYAEVVPPGAVPPEVLAGAAARGVTTIKEAPDPDGAAWVGIGWDPAKSSWSGGVDQYLEQYGGGVITE